MIAWKRSKALDASLLQSSTYLATPLSSSIFSAAVLAQPLWLLGADSIHRRRPHWPRLPLSSFFFHFGFGLQSPKSPQRQWEPLAAKASCTCFDCHWSRLVHPSLYILRLVLFPCLVVAIAEPQPGRCRRFPSCRQYCFPLIVRLQLLCFDLFCLLLRSIGSQAKVLQLLLWPRLPL